MTDKFNLDVLENLADVALAHDCGANDAPSSSCDDAGGCVEMQKDDANGLKRLIAIARAADKMAERFGQYAMCIEPTESQEFSDGNLLEDSKPCLKCEGCLDVVSFAAYRAIRGDVA